MTEFLSDEHEGCPGCGTEIRDKGEGLPWDGWDKETGKSCGGLVYRILCPRCGIALVAYERDHRFEWSKDTSDYPRQSSSEKREGMYETDLRKGARRKRVFSPFLPVPATPDS